MRTVALLLLAGCGGSPALANAPHPPAAAVAGVAAAAAAAITLADPNAGERASPRRSREEDKRPVDVKQNVPPDVFDRLDHPPPTAAPTTDDPPTKTRARKGPPPKLPSPRDISDPNDR